MDREALRKDYALIRASLRREQELRRRHLQGDKRDRGVAEMQGALDALARLGAAVRVVLDEEERSAEVKQGELLPAPRLVRGY